jgi:tRNA G46 methylase TrmB
MVVRSISAMDLPAPWTDIGEHGVLPRASHDEVARFNAIANVNAFLAGRLAPRVRTAYERRAKAAYRQREGREPENRGEVDEALRTDPAYRVWSTLRRNAMETRQQAGRQLVLRQARELRDRARALNAGAGTLQLDPQLRMPPYVAAVDTHLMPGGYTSEVVADDVTPAANYDAGLFVTIGGSGGPWNDGAGRALVAWLGEHHSGFQPRRIADLGCGLGHNTLPVREAFPGAEVIAIDVAAPMLRYGHARARALGISDVTFSQLRGAPAAAARRADGASGAAPLPRPRALRTVHARLGRPLQQRAVLDGAAREFAAGHPGALRLCAGPGFRVELLASGPAQGAGTGQRPGRL